MYVTMAKWIHPKSISHSAKSSVAQESEAQYQALQNLYGIDYEQSNLKKRPKLYQKSLKMFYLKEIEFEQRFTNALSNLNTENEAIREAHSLKGIAATLGMTKLHGLAYELEMACRDKSEQIDLKLKALTNELNQILEGLKNNAPFLFG